MRAVALMIATGLSWALLSGCAAPAPEGPPVTLSKHTEAHLKNYLQTIGQGNYGAFAVTPDGSRAFYTYCTDGGNCERADLNFDALAGCKKLSGTDCLILAHNRVLQRAYTVTP